MTHEEIAKVSEAMNDISWHTGANWDRCSPRDNGGMAFGWIDRSDGKRDFVVLFWDAEGFGQMTSSAKHTRTISKILFGSDEGHNDCQRVHDVFGDSVKGKVVPIPDGFGEEVAP